MKKVLAGFFVLAMFAVMTVTSFAEPQKDMMYDLHVNASKVSNTTYYVNSDEIQKIDISAQMNNEFDNYSNKDNGRTTFNVTYTLKAKGVPTDFWLEITGDKSVAKAAVNTAPKGSRVEEIENGVLVYLGRQDSSKSITPTVVFNKDVDYDKLSWNLQLTDNEEYFYDEDEVSVTPAPTYEAAAPQATPYVQITAKPRATASTSTATSTTSPAPEKTINIQVTGKTTTGDVLKPGTYKIIGKGDVVITDENGKEKSKMTLSTDANKTTPVTVKEGDKITLTGAKDAYIQFKDGETTATAKPAATATAKPATTVAPEKTNPKTGDSTPIIGLSIIALLALGGIVYVTFSSKKNSK